MPISHSPGQRNPARRSHGSRRSRLSAVSGLVAGALVAGALAGCAESADQVPSIGFAIDNNVTTYNGNTVDGAASGARQAFVRVLPGFTYTGPEGGAVADTDIGTATVVPGEVLTVAYKLDPKSVYSDGVPMSCDDLVLAWAAGSGKFTRNDGSQAQLFDSASTAGYSDIERVDCQTGSKDATVTFRAGRGFNDWASLFGAGAMMPAHVVARAAGVPDLVAAVQSADTDAMTRIADFWNTGWKMTPGQLDSTLFPASGPYKIESFTAEDGLVLVANDRWWGNRPATSRIVVWPNTHDLGAAVGDGKVEVIDIGTGSVADLDLGDGFDASDVPSRNVEQFVLATSGVFQSSAARRAFAACLPREELAAEFGSTAEDGSGLGVGVVDTRFTPPDSLIYQSVAAAAGARFRQTDTEGAAASLAESGTAAATVRIGYLAPNKSRSDIVATVAAACAPSGITIEDAGSPDFVPSMLRAGSVDAVLGGTAAAAGAAGTASGTDAMYALRTGIGSNFGSFSNGRFDQIVDQLAIDRSTGTQLALATEAEGILWNELPSIPLFNQSRTVGFGDGLQGALPNPTRSGAGWNMDKWVLRR